MKPIDALPAILQKNAQSMMRRMIVAMQSEMTKDPAFVNATYYALLIKLGENDLVREFEDSFKDSMEVITTGSGRTVSAGLSFELVDDSSACVDSDFSTSTIEFEQLCEYCKLLGISGIGMFEKDVFLKPLKSALLKARIRDAEAVHILPVARRALNAELVNLYQKLGPYLKKHSLAKVETATC